MTRDELFAQWLDAEKAASSAELEFAKVGQAAADPRVGELAKRASDLRAEADRLFRLLPRHPG